MPSGQPTEKQFCNDGGYAFPQANGGGMTLREYFAGQALAALISADECSGRSTLNLAQYAIQHADELIAELQK